MAHHAPRAAIRFANFFAARPAPEAPPDRYTPLLAAEAVDFLYRNLQSVIISVLLLPLLLVAVMWRHVDHRLLAAWFGLLVLVAGARLLLRRLYLRRAPPAEQAPRWGRYFAATALVNGLLWGGAGVLFFVPGDAALQVFLYTSVIGLATGSLIAASFLPLGFYAFAIPALALCAARLAAEGGAGYMALAAVLLLHIAVYVPIARNTHRAALAAMRLRFENLDLVQALSEQRDAAERANIAKSKFLAAASHDLRQPLHALGLFTAVLDVHIKGREARRVMDRVNDSVQALRKMFDVLLDVSRLDAGVLQPALQDFPLSELFRALANDYRPEAEAKGLAFECEPTDAIVRSDPALLERILRNYVSNAVRYTEVGGVRIASAPLGAHVRIEVADTGIGIPADKQRDIFEEFHQLGNPERDRNKGLGLGLAIVERAARLLGHPIGVESAPGQGSRFSVTVPRGERVRVATTVEEPLPGDLAGLRVLVVDDEIDAREGMRVLLGQWGCRVLVAASEDEAVAAARAAYAPDAVIADYRLREGRTGVQAIARLRREFDRDVPALICTGDTAPERLREARASGFQVAHKPIAAATLRAFLGGVRREAQRRARAPSRRAPAVPPTAPD